MPPIDTIRASNDRIKSTLPAGTVAVFVGGTNGIGESTLKQYALRTVRPKIYIIGRSQDSGNRIVAECKVLNDGGEYVFISSPDLGLIKNVDAVCAEITKKERVLNLLFLTQGALDRTPETSEGLDHCAALTIYGRTRFILNLLPLLERATVLRRVVSVLVGGKEGPVDLENIQSRDLPVSKGLAVSAHRGSITTLSLEHMAKTAPSVSFVHGYPGLVQTGIFRGSGLMMAMVRVAVGVLGPFMAIPVEESGERHLYLATSAKYPAASGMESADGVSVADEGAAANGSDGQVGSGVYTVDEWGNSAGGKAVEQLLQKMRGDGTAHKLWADTEEQFLRITGKTVL